LDVDIQLVLNHGGYLNIYLISAGYLKHPTLVGAFNPFEKYESKWESSPGRGENQK